VGFIVTAVMYARWREWHGGWCYGPRFFGESMPILALLFAYAYAALRPNWTRAAARGLVALSVAIHLLGVYTYGGEYSAWHGRNIRQGRRPRPLCDARHAIEAHLHCAWRHLSGARTATATTTRIFMRTPTLTRRTFTTTAASALALTAVSAARVYGANDKIRLGFIGVGNRGSQLLDAFVQLPDIQVAAVCDIFKPYLDRADKRFAGKATTYTDFRKLIESKEIDAVVVATPDHWHALQTIAACRAGKDVYCEKPAVDHDSRRPAHGRSGPRNRTNCAGRYASAIVAIVCEARE